MSTPSFFNADNGAGVVQHRPTSTATADEDNMDDIPRRHMRVKVLYTFDDDNKSNCLARLPNALSVPVVSLDEATQVGVIELKTCIQAIVLASPELVAKLGHDYTVYAYDYSEYETPLVGQGMLSRILASASTTPNAPAEQSQTMVTGRVCKNILGLFSNGVKETLEVKLKLVPVPTCLQSEYVENMERYHSLSKLMPAGLDYSAWADFLKANPTIAQLAQPNLDDRPQDNRRPSIGGVEMFHQMLARPSPSQEPPRNDSFYDQSTQSFNSQSTRASSPAMSTVSFHHYQYNPDSRPASRASFRNESQFQTQQFQLAGGFQEQQEEGPAKKRARIEKAKRPKRTALITNNESLRVTASTAASVRLHKPVATNPAAALASAEQVPRAPTPRPGDANGPHGRRLSRPSAPSLLRNASLNEASPYLSPYDSAASSDNALDSSDDDRGGSPGDTPMDIPSSPPVMPRRTISPAPSSPVLPTVPVPTDSGFVSDMALGREEEEANPGNKPWDGSDLPTAADVRTRPRQDRSHHPWQEVNPGPVELLPKSYVPRPKTNSRPRPMQPITESIEQAIPPAPASTANEMMAQTAIQNMVVKGPQNGSNATSPPTDLSIMSIQSQQFPPAPRSTTAGSPDSMMQNPIAPSDIDAQAYSRSATPNLPPQQAKASKPRGLPRSHTWSGMGEVMSEGLAPAETKAPRSGSGAKRRKCIKEKLEEAIAAGKIPPHCNNCGEIETPTWRKAYTRIENGPAPDIQLPENSGILAFEVIEPTEENGGELKHRVFKNNLAAEEKAMETYELLNLCNSCGLWLLKKGAMRPQKQWEKAAQQASDTKPKRKRNPPKKKMKEADELMSDAIVPHSEPAMPVHPEEARIALDGTVDGAMQPPMQAHVSSERAATEGPSLDHNTAQAALQRAIQSSPAGFRGSKESPIDIEPDLTPRPTRRLLFPSPRKDGEVKSLADSRTFISPTAKLSAPVKQPLDGNGEDIDKENCPPPVGEDDDLSHLFEAPESPKTTPKKSQPFQDLLKTPTPGSRSRRVPLTPKQGVENADLPLTPSRLLLTPRTTRGATLAPETPFTRQLNALLSDCMPSSPNHGIDFSTFPTFNTPGRNQSSAQFAAFLHDDFLSSDMPMPSSPPHGSLGFDLYEDPSTSTVGLWSGASIFGSDAIMPEEGGENGNDSVSKNERPGSEEAMVLKMKVGGISVDFSAMIEDVSATRSSTDSQEQSLSPEGEVHIKPEPTTTPA